MPELTLLIGEREYGGWTNVQLDLGIEQLASAFRLSVTETVGTPAAWAIHPGDACTVKVDGRSVVVGQVDDRNPRRDTSGRSAVVLGRSRTGDLVDCSAVLPGGSWSNRTAAQICTDICRPFGIAVTAATDVGAPVKSFAIQQGETAYEAIERVTRMRGLLPIDSGNGGLLLTRAGVERIATPLVAGSNIEEAEGTLSWRDRFSNYIIKGQTDSDDGLQTRATAADPEIKRYRPLIVLAEQGDGATYRDRALWERNVRRGRGSRYACTVTEWSHAGGVWLPNRLVRVVDPDFGLDDDLLISAVSLVKDSSGSRASLTLCRPEAFALIAEPPRRKKESAL